MRITLHGRGAHGSLPQAAVDPVVLAAMIVVHLQTVFSREIAPNTTAVVTVGSIQAGTKSNVIPDSAVLLLNIRMFDTETRDTLLSAIKRIVRAECEASGCPQGPDFEMFDHFPLTDNDERVTSRVASAFGAFFADRAATTARQSASEDFSDTPHALNASYTFGFIGGSDSDRFEAATKTGRVAQDIPVNPSPSFAPVIQPTLDTGTSALIVAAMAWLAR